MSGIRAIVSAGSEQSEYVYLGPRDIGVMTRALEGLSGSAVMTPAIAAATMLGGRLATGAATLAIATASATALGGRLVTGAASLTLATSHATATNFTPANVANMVAWYKADAGITQSSNLVSNWADQSGNGRDVSQATSAKQPTFNSSGGSNNQPYLSFDGTDDFLLSGTFTFSQIQTIYVVAEYQSSAGTIGTLVDGKTGNTGRIYRTSASVEDIYSGTNLGLTVPSAQRGTWVYFVGVFNGASSTFKLYGGGAGALKASNSGNAGTNSTMGGVTIGAFGPGTADWAAANISEVICYSGSVASGDDTNIRGYLTAKYGI